jgi:hypothetical protein
VLHLLLVSPQERLWECGGDHAMWWKGSFSPHAKGRGCIDNILRKTISPKIKYKVWIINMSMLSIYHLVSFSKKYPYHIFI